MADTVALSESETTTHNNILQDLLNTREKLMLIDPASLDTDANINWNEELYQLGLAISAAESAELDLINKEYAEQLPVISQATNQLAADLESMEETNAVLSTVNAALGTITSVVTLLK